jgi:hypothetical protein
MTGDCLVVIGLAVHGFTRLAHVAKMALKGWSVGVVVRLVLLLIASEIWPVRQMMNNNSRYDYK